MRLGGNILCNYKKAKFRFGFCYCINMCNALHLERYNSQRIIRDTLYSLIKVHVRNMYTQWLQL